MSEKFSKKELLSSVVKDVSVTSKTTVSELVKQFGDAGGFVAKDVYLGSVILRKVFQDKDCYTFLSSPADIIATGTRGIVRDLLKDKKVDCFITTPGTVAHDLARLWTAYYSGSFFLDDKQLHRAGVNRLGNVLIPNESYGAILEERLQPLFKEMYDAGKREVSTVELCEEIGKRLEGVKGHEESIVYWAWKNQIPIVIPGPTDGALGFQLLQFMKNHSDFKVNVFKDELLLKNIVLTAKKTGALMIGGGISKHHVIWWNQFCDGLDYAVYITTAVEYDGSLSGAPMREAISWGKVKETATHVTAYGDATVLLPLIVGAALD